MNLFKLIKRKIITAAFLLGISYAINGQTSTPHIWSVEPLANQDQLSSESFKSVAEDRDGYLWIGTNSGLARYDGYAFKKYTYEEGDTTTLNHNRTSYVFVDHLNTIWVGTRVGINRYLPQCDCFQQYNVEQAPLNSVPDGEVNWIIEDHENQMWVVSQHGGLYRYDRDEDTFERFLYRKEDPVNLADDQLRVIMEDNEGWLWIGTGEPFVPTYTGGGLIRFHPETKQAKRYLNNSETFNGLIDNRVSALLQDRQGNIWVGTCNGGIHLYKAEKDQFVSTGHSGPGIYAPQIAEAPWSACPHIRILHEDQWGGIWVGNFNAGLYRFESGDTQKPPIHFTHKPDRIQSLGNDLVWNIFEDSQGRFWVSNMDGGLNKIDPFQHKFNVHFENQRISAIYTSPSQPEILWLGDWEKGCIRWNRHTGEKRYFKESNDTQKGPGSNVIFGFLEDEDRALWIGHDKGLSRYDQNKGFFEHYNLINVSQAVNKSVAVYCIHEGKNEVLWLGTWGDGLYRFDKKTGQYENLYLPLKQGEQNDNYNQSIYAIEEDEQGRLLIGTWMNGLYLYDPSVKKFEHHLEGIGVLEICKTKAGNFWLGTYSNGLLNYSMQNGLLQTITTQEGLAGNEVSNIMEDENGTLWIGTNHGLSRYTPKTSSFFNYTKADGLPYLQFLEFSAGKTTDEYFYFGATKGLVEFKPSEVRNNPYPPKLHIQDVLIFEESICYPSDSLGKTRLAIPPKLKLHHYQNELTFQYVGLHYSNPALNQYRYRLKPYEEKWVEAGNKRSARYTNLSPGTYTFEVIACNNDGLWADQPASLFINITPPWWQTYWAYLLYLLTLTGILYSVYYYQKRRWALKASLELEQEKSHRLREMDEFKSRFYTNITHEFRTPLTVIEGLVGQIRENPKWKLQERLDLIKRNSRKLLQLINQMLDLSQLESGGLKLNYEQGNIIAYLAYLVESCQPLAYDKNIRIAFFSYIKHLEMDYDPLRIQQIIDNLVANAIKFTPEYGKITVAAHVIEQASKGKSLSIQVEDTGYGIPASKLPHIFDRFYQAVDSSVRKAEGTGLGLALVKELVEMMEGSIRVQSEEGGGSCFTVCLPIRRQAEKGASLPVEPIGQPYARPQSLLKDKSKLNDEARPLVLIVEDNRDVTYYLRSCLDRMYQIREARNGEEALKMALEHLPDLIISDVMMPKMDGFELCKALRKEEQTRYIPIIILTARVAQKDKMEGLEYGADAYLAKPFQKEELLIRIKNLLAVGHKLQTNELLQHSATSDPFLQNVREIIEAELDNADFSVHHLSRAVGMSRVQIHRKIKADTGLSTSQYIRKIQMLHAYELLKNSDLTIAEIGYKVGFKTPSHFSKVYTRYFGEPPSETRK